MSADKRLEELGIVLPEASSPAAHYMNFMEVNGLLFLSGKGPSGSGGLKPKGKLGQDYTTAEGYQFARQTGIEILAVLKSAVGSLDKVKRVVKIQGFVNADPQFEEHHKVLDGCSDLMVEIFGEKGTHTRSVLGAPSLRDNLPIVIDSIFEIETMLPPALSDEEAELAALEYLSDDALWTLSQERMAGNLQNRMQVLMDKNSLGTITPAEYRELEALAERGLRLTVRKSKAMALLGERGWGH